MADGVRIEHVHIKRGRPDEREKTAVGVASISGKDLEGALDPTNPAVPFGGTIDPAGQAGIGLQNPVTGAWSTRFRGYIEDHDYDLDVSGKFANFETRMVDALDLLNDAEVVPDNSGETTVPLDMKDKGDVYYKPQPVDDRIYAAIADAATSLFGTEWPADLLSIFSGNVYVQGTSYAARTPLLQVIQDAVDAEFPGVGQFYADALGVLTFHGRKARWDPDTVAAQPGSDWNFRRWKVGDAIEFAIDPDTAICSGLQLTRGKTNLINAALVTPAGIKDADKAGQLVTDPSSIAAYGPRSISYEGLITLGGKDDGLNANDEVKLIGDYYVQNYAVPRTRVSRITFRPKLPDSPEGPALWALMCGVEISDIVHVKTTHIAGGLDEDFYVEGIEYEWTPLNKPGLVEGSLWHDVTMTLDVSPAAYWTPLA